MTHNPAALSYEPAPPFPQVVKREIEQALGVGAITVRPLQGGTNARTFLAAYHDHGWVVRFEPGGELQVRRAFGAQKMAQAAGVAVPEVVAYQLDPRAAESYLWTVEERVAGVPFVPQALDPRRKNALSYRLGEQLRILHSITVEAYGLLSPEPYGTHPTVRAWLDHEAARIEPALRIAGADLHLLPLLADFYAELGAMHDDPPRLCHGDCAESNILVGDDHVAALIDWEWARGGDPPWNVSYWLFWHQEMEALDALLSGYQPANVELFRGCVLRYTIVNAIKLILVYEDQGDPAGIRFARRKLEAALENRPWE